MLSLSPSGGKWATEFYRARVRHQPCDRGQDEPRGYGLQIGREYTIVPERFIAAIPVHWNDA